MANRKKLEGAKLKRRTITLNDADWDRLHEAAEADGLSVCEAVRNVLNQWAGSVLKDRRQGDMDE